MKLKFLLLFAFIFSLFSCTNKEVDIPNKNSKTKKKNIIQKINNKIDFSFFDINYKNYKLTQFKDKVILINFWGSWVIDTKKEIETLKKLNKKFKNTNLKIISISFDEIDDKNFQNFLNINNINFDIYFTKNNKEILKFFPQINIKIPCSYLLNKNLTIKKTYKENLNFKKIENDILGIINEK